MSRRVRWICLLPLALAALTGCGDRKHPVALQGTWKLADFNTPQLNLLPAEAQKATKMKIIRQGTASFTLKSDGAATLARKPITLKLLGKEMKFKEASQTGTWEADGQKLKTSLNYSLGADGPDPKAMEGEGVPYTLDSSGKTLKFSPGGVDTTWTKQ